MYHPLPSSFVPANSSNINLPPAPETINQILPELEEQAGQQCEAYFPNFPTPSPAPWNLDSMPWKLASNTSEHTQPSGVMEFQARAISPFCETQRRFHLHQKRKSDSVPEFPTKQFISEEKITAHFNGLHISSNYIGNDASTSIGQSGTDKGKSIVGKSFTNLTFHDYQVTAKELEEKLLKANRITICEEVNKFNKEERKVSYLPEALMNRLEKPCRALVLWQPPPFSTSLKAHTTTDTVIETDDNDENERISHNSIEVDMTDQDIPDDPNEIEEIDDFIDNNNTCRVNFNNVREPDDMDEDL